MKDIIRKMTMGLMAGTLTVLLQVSGSWAADTLQRQPTLRTLQPAQPTQTAPTTPTATRTLVTQLARATVRSATPNRPALVSGGSGVRVNLSGSSLNLLSSAQVLLNGRPVSNVTARLGSSGAASRQLTLTAQSGAQAGNYQVRLKAVTRIINLSATVLTAVVNAQPSTRRTVASTSTRTMTTAQTATSARVPLTGENPGNTGTLTTSTSTTPKTSTMEPLDRNRTAQTQAMQGEALRTPSVGVRDTMRSADRAPGMADRLAQMKGAEGFRGGLQEPGSGAKGLDLLSGRGDLSGRLQANKMPGNNIDLGELGGTVGLDSGIQKLVGQAEQFRSVGQSPTGMSALNPAKGSVPDGTGFTVDSRLAAGGDAASDPKPADTTTNGKGSDTVITIKFPEGTTEEEKDEVEAKVKNEYPDAEIRRSESTPQDESNLLRHLMGRVWAAMGGGGSKYERYVPNSPSGVRGQCPPESMTCGITGKTWAQLSPGERKKFCDEAESQLDQFKDTGDYNQSSGVCDAESLKEPDWSKMFAGRLAPYILTDESGDSEIYVPVIGEVWTRGDLVDTLPDPGEWNGGSGGTVIPGKDPDQAGGSAPRNQ